jgi:hypothetical protein
MDTTVPEIEMETGELNVAAVPVESPDAIRPARPGCQPVRNLRAFLALLPDFGEDGVSLLDAIVEDRARRRAALEAEEC